MIEIKKLKPTFVDLLVMRKLALESSINNLPIERFQIRLSQSVIGLFFTKFFFNNFYFIFNKGLIGYAITRRNLIRGFFISKKEQGKGYGKKLLNFVEKDLKNKFRTINLKPTKNSISFYISQGYVQDKLYLYKDL